MIKNILITVTILLLVLVLITIFNPELGLTIAGAALTVLIEPIAFAMKLGLYIRGLS